MSDTLETQVHQIASDVFNLPMSRITAETSPDNIDNWDSVQHLNFVLALEGALGISLEPEDIEKIRSVGTAVEVAREKGAK